MRKHIQAIRAKIKASLSDKYYVYIIFLLTQHQFLHLKHPRSYSEKVQWLKVYGNLENYTSLADKYEVRDYVSRHSCGKYLIPLIGVWDKFDEVPFETLPDKFVIKATHGSGYNIIVTDKNSIDLDDMKTRINHWLSENYYDVTRETQYKNCIPRIIVEKYIEGDEGDLKDYKFYCFNGIPELLMVASDRLKSLTIDIVDTDWNSLSVQIGNYPNSIKIPPQPKQFQTMLKLAKELSDGLPFVRVDLYTAKDKVYFGELTFTPSSGLEVFGSREFNRWFGTKIELEAYKSVSV
jgi:hypothetical protein